MSRSVSRSRLELRFASGITPGLEDEVRQALDELAYFPEAAECEVDRLAGGGSNLNLIVVHGTERYVLRLAEQDVSRFTINRADGLEAHRRLAAAGIAPELCASLANGHLLARFVAGPIVTAETVCDPGMLEGIATVLHAVHEAGPIGGTYSVFEQHRIWAAIAEDEGLELPADFEALKARCDAAEAAFEKLRLEPRLCHNDVQLQNFIVGSDRLWLLDFEYAGMGNPYFDLAMVAVNGELDENGENRLLGTYFGRVREVDRARLRLLAFMSAMRDATWAVIAKPVHDLDFDYDAWSAEYYGRARAFVFGEDFDRCLLAAGEEDETQT